MIYVASRVSRAPMWRALRARGIAINSSWIDEDGEGQTDDFSELWNRIQREISAARGLIFYADVTDAPWKGALVEVGMALAMGKPVAVVVVGKLDGRTQRPVGSWILSNRVSRCATVTEAIAAIVTEGNNNG